MQTVTNKRVAVKKRREKKMGKVKINPTAIRRNSVRAEFTKAKNLLFTCVKQMDGDKSIKTSATVSKQGVGQLLKAAKGGYSAFRKALIQLRVTKTLQVDSQAKKQGLTKNTAYDNTTRAAALALNLSNLTPSNHRNGSKVKKVKRVKAAKKVKK